MANLQDLPRILLLESFKSNPGISRGLALAVLTGAAVALAMVQLAIH